MKTLISDLKQAITAPRNDGKLHFSQHLQHDRHTALYYKFGYPVKDEQPWGNVFPLLQGTGVHETVHAMMHDMVDLYWPEKPVSTTLDGYEWTGTVDAYILHEGQHWILDYKTISGAGMEYLHDKPKPEHVLQVSAYYHFSPKPVDKDWKTAILYLPSSPDYRRRWSEPVFMEFEPLSKDTILERMREVHAGIEWYAESGIGPAPPQGEAKWKKKGNKYELWYTPHYSSLFCPWKINDEHEYDSCGCSKEKRMLMATFEDGELSTESFSEAYIMDLIGLPDV
jgi:hypothetical protein